ncbi:MAG TPA: hypothetical protein VHB21_00655 [Minicystis sp.]|nr:hypothetical protein [Minicystis sp.]
MTSFEIGVVAVVALLVAFQGWLTVRVLKSRLFDRKQKIMQMQLIWLLPILGAGLVFAVLQEDARAESPRPPAQLK